MILSRLSLSITLVLSFLFSSLEIQALAPWITPKGITLSKTPDMIAERRSIALEYTEQVLTSYDFKNRLRQITERSDHKLPPNTSPEKIAFIGGGPAGLDGAIEAALRGHNVTLFEQRSHHYTQSGRSYTLRLSVDKVVTPILESLIGKHFLELITDYMNINILKQEFKQYLKKNHITSFSEQDLSFAFRLLDQDAERHQNFS